VPVLGGGSLIGAPPSWDGGPPGEAAQGATGASAESDSSGAPYPPSFKEVRCCVNA